MDLDGTPAERKQLEYASQHFGFTPDSLTETITIYALDHMTDVLNKTRDHCTKVFSGKVPPSEMQESFELIKERFTTSCDRVLEDFSKYLKKNVLTVPKHVVLPEDRVHNVERKASDNEENGSDNRNKATLSNGMKMAEDLKAFERNCGNANSVRYKLAIMESKLSNLNRLREYQMALAKDTDLIGKCDKLVNGLVEDKTRALEARLIRLRSLMDKLDGEALHDDPAKDVVSPEDWTEDGDDLSQQKQHRKRKMLEVKLARDTVGKRLRQDLHHQDEAAVTKENLSLLDNTTTSTVG